MYRLLAFSVLLVTLIVTLPLLKINAENFQDYITIGNETVSSYRFSENTGNCKNCNPKCSWKCNKPICNKVCKPKCDKPSCFINCDEPTPASCQVDCRPPKCKVVCPERVEDICEENPCRIKCKDPVCKVKCTEPRPFCRVNCDPPRCGWKCKKPKNCPKPECKMVCDKLI